MPRSNWDSVSITVLLIGAIVLCCVLFVDTVFADSKYLFEGTAVVDTSVDPIGTITTLELNHNWKASERWILWNGESKDTQFITISISDSMLPSLITSSDTLGCVKGVARANLLGFRFPTAVCK